MIVEFVAIKRKWIAKLGLGTVLVLAGVVVGILGVLVIASLVKPDLKEVEAIKQQYTIEYIKSEQKRLGIDCGALNATTRSFLENNIKPILSASQSSRNWYKDIHADVRNLMDGLRDNYFACGRLYRAAQNVKWDGLNGLKYTIELDREITVLNTLVGIEFCNEHDVMCLDQGFRDLRDAVTKIETRLAESP